MFFRTAVILTSALMVLFLGVGVVFAQNLAMFDIPTTTPPSAQAGKEIVFEVRITNTGIETWMSAEYSVLVKIFDANKNYLTESDEVRQFEDIGPGEVLTTEVPFDIPADYSGTYYYTIAIEFEHAFPLDSPYFSLRISPIEKPKIVTGALTIGYVKYGRSSPSTSVDLNVFNQPTSKSSLKLQVSGRNSEELSELKNYSLDYRSKSMNLSLGQLSSPLSYLTLRRLHGVRVETAMKGINFTVLGDLPQPQKVSTASHAKNLYGMRGVAQLTNNFTLAGNYVESKKNKASVASLEGELAIAPELTMSGEYAHSSLQENQTGSRQDGAFRLTVSRTSPKLSFDGLYQKVGRDFYLLENSGLVQDSEKYDLSLNYSLGQYIRGRVRNNLYQDQLSQRDTVSRRTTGSMGLSLFFPHLPSLAITYGVNKNLSAGVVNWPRNNITNTLTTGVSKLIGRTRLSITQTQTGSQDRTKSLSKRDTLSTTYGIYTPLTRQVTLSVSYRDSHSKGPTASSRTQSRYIRSGLRYTIIPTKLTSSVEYAINENTTETGGYKRTTTTLNMSYYFTQKGSLSIQYTMQSNRNLASHRASSSDSGRAQLNYTYEITKNHDLNVRYSLMSYSSSTSSPQSQDIRLTYSYKF